jgi:hypothetical protein
MLFNSGFERTVLSTSGSPEPQDYGWMTNDAAHIQFVDALVPSTEQITPGGSQVARFTADVSSAIGVLWQPVTLCPNVSYVVGGRARQNASVEDGCSADVFVGEQYVGSLNPDETWTNIWTDLSVYTVGPYAANASVNLEIRLECTGLSDNGQYGVLELDDLSLAVPSVITPKKQDGGT